ncbi:Ring finger protein [Fasciola hepatica]|uniref:RING-type E3 ubiquitin transferase n=1 Tax=Fasciola hepatica TaxID=6192 RepID=A0A2H1CA92_FASHE|nr:Ring finger protein [Fasciola hepatica]
MSTDDKVTCPICLGLLYRPVALPCAHEFCRECILNAVEHTSFQCPICRYRLSNWLRKVKDIDSAVDLDKENHLRHLFPDYYRQKELGKSPMLSAAEQRCLKNLNVDNVCHRDGIPAIQGEVYLDYVKQMEKEARMRAAEEKKNEEASLALALQLLAEDSIAEDDLSTTRIVDPEIEDHQNIPLSSLPSCASSSQISSRFPSTEQNKLTRRRTLLDYAIYKGTNPSEAAQDQVSRDAEFAQNLESKYRKIASPVLTRSRTRSRTLRVRHK